jgi:hypothetical protein
LELLPALVSRRGLVVVAKQGYGLMYVAASPKRLAMNDLLRAVLLFAVCFIPTTAVVFWIRGRRRELSAASRVPFKELRRRPAGESLRVKLEEFDERIQEESVYLALVPVVCALVAYFGRKFDPLFWTSAFILSLVSACVVGVRLMKLVKGRANYQLGFDGERFVGEELNRLVASGFEVYHDLPFDGFNMDHVLVGRQGVFLVETKTRRKPVKVSGAKEFHVEFDGRRIRWPMGADDYGVQQALNNARTLGQWLSGAVGEPVSATPILTLPGWMVDRTAPGNGVHVLNPKEIVKVCDNKERNLSDNLVKRICYQLEERCKLTFE